MGRQFRQNNRLITLVLAWLARTSPLPLRSLSVAPLTPGFRGNVYWTLGGAPFRITAQKVPYASQEAWRAAGQETLSGAPVGLNVDPRFVAMGTGRDLLPAALVGTLSAYDLRRSSPLRGAAVNLVGAFGVMPGPVDFHGRLLDLATLAPGACQPPVVSARAK